MKLYDALRVGVVALPLLFGGCRSFDISRAGGKESDEPREEVTKRTSRFYKLYTEIFMPKGLADLNQDGVISLDEELDFYRRVNPSLIRALAVEWERAKAENPIGLGDLEKATASYMCPPSTTK